MSHRQFVDQNGTLWTVWDVHPSRVERDLELARLRTPGLEHEPARENRHSIPLDGHFAEGWLCFESDQSKRRLAPIPTGWERLNVAGLVSLCDRASRVRRAGDAASETATA